MGYAVAVAYVLIAVAEIVVHHAARAVPCLCIAAIIAGPLVLVSHVGGSPPDKGDGGFGADRSGPDGGDDPPQPPWWPEFEAKLRSHVDSTTREDSETSSPV